MRKLILLVVVIIMMGILSGCATESTMMDAKNGQINVRDIPSLNKTESVSVNVTAPDPDYS